MVGKYLWIALFVTLQISTVLCRSTGIPSEEDKEYSASPTSDAVDGKAEELNETLVGGTMAYDDFVDADTYITYEYSRNSLTAAAIVGIIYAVFTILSLILGCILIFCRKKEPRRGYVVSSNTGQQVGEVQQHATSGVTQQNQNLYPAVHYSK